MSHGVYNRHNQLDFFLVHPIIQGQEAAAVLLSLVQVCHDVALFWGVGCLCECHLQPASTCGFNKIALLFERAGSGYLNSVVQIAAVVEH